MELAARMPPEFKLRGLKRKYMLKRSAERLLPKDVVWRKKAGFGAPIRFLLRGPLRPWWMTYYRKRQSGDGAKAGPEARNGWARQSPLFFRQTTSFGNNRSALRFNMYFRFRPRSLNSGGMRAASSIISKLRNGTRTSVSRPSKSCRITQVQARQKGLKINI